VLALALVRRDAPEIAVDLTSRSVPDEVIVRLWAPYASLPDATLEARLGGRILDRVPELDSLRLQLTRDESPAEAAARLRQLPQVAMVEPNHIVRAAAIPNDAFYSAQSAYLALVQGPSAWDIEPGDDAVLVAVLDSGLDLTHPDLQGRYWINPFEESNNGVDDDSNGCIDDSNGCSLVSAASVDRSCQEPQPGAVADDNGHGTFVSGIIAAQGNNGIGISGAAPNVTIVPVKILDCQGAGTALEAAQGILYAARIGARVANISFGADGESLTLANAIREANDRYGMVIVAATGNEGSSRVTCPANLPQVMAVASSGTPSDADTRSPFSDWGPEVAFAAPGLNIVSTVPPAFCGHGWLCVEDQPYAVASGTSFAAPIVSALAALLLSHQPHLSPRSVREIIASTAEPLPDGATPNWDGAGRIRMREALSQPRFFLGAAGVAKQ
jgi:subtilisin family serine protease